MPVTGLIIPTLLMIWAAAGVFPARERTTLARYSAVIDRLAGLPPMLWAALGVLAFCLPVLEYWVTAKSHGNGLAGFLPWADATEYFQCSEVFLLNLDGPAHCAKRPYYFAFFADLLWISGNNLQIALLLQALCLGGAAVIFSIGLSQLAGWPGALGSYAVLYVYAAALCSGLVMTENIGFILGALGLLVLLFSARDRQPAMFLVGIAILAAAMTVRPGALFVLPALGAWYLVYGHGSLGRRFAISAAAGVASCLAVAVVLSPILITGGQTGSAHSNFSYSLYGLVVGGKGWIQVTVDHPEIYDPGGGSQTDKVYALALEKLLERPDLALWGYFKGILKYFDSLFRYATEFKPLRLVLLLVPWCLGILYALRRWRDRPFAMLLAIEAGIIVSSPFLVYDGHNRAFASTVVVDAAFVALGMFWLGEKLGATSALAPAGRRPALTLSCIAAAALVLPLAMFAVIRPGEISRGVKPPECEPGQMASVLAPGTSTLVLPLVAAGEESMFPLKVNAAGFASRFGRGVHSRDQLRRQAGSTLVWGIRLEEGARAALTTFVWNDTTKTSAGRIGICIDPPEPGKRIGTATRAKLR